MLNLKYKKNKINFIDWRFTFLHSCTFLFFIILLIRITWLQIVIPDMLVHQSNMRSLRIQEIFSSRGIITDRFGKPLALNEPVKSIWVDPKELHNSGGINTLDNRWKTLSDTLNIPFNQMISRINGNSKCRFTYLARQVSLDVSNYIKQLKLPGVYLKKESRRYYPEGEVTAHVIGFTNIDNQGIEGIEKSFDKWLSGEPGSRKIRKDRFNRVIEDISFINSQSGHSLVLSLDERLQKLVYSKLRKAVFFNKAKSGSSVLVDVSTGEILAMANIPSYDPNNFIKNIKDAMRNRAVTDVFEPGSTVKPMVVMTALQHGIINKNSILNTIPYQIKGYKIKDATCYNELTITGILQKSSNVGISKLALSMPATALIDTYSRFGLGKATNVGLVGERIGLYPKKKWNSIIDRATFSFGYGLMVTPLQLARVYATIGSYGIYRPLSIIKTDPIVPGKRVFPESIVHDVVHMMESVALPGGSGSKAAIKGYRIAIKTGTVKKVGSAGRYINRYVAYTAGVAPASSPRFALVVVINDPNAEKYYGGAVSAPVFGEIMGGVLRIVNVVPDGIKTSKYD